MERFLMEAKNLKVGLVPVDLNAGANTGLRVPMANVKRLAFLIITGTSTAAVMTWNFLQHDAASSGNSKALAISNPYYIKHGAATVFTRTVPGAAADTYDIATQFAADGGLAVFEVLAEDLDIENGFAWVSLSALDATAAKLGAVLVLADSDFKPAYAGVI